MKCPSQNLTCLILKKEVKALVMRTMWNTYFEVVQWEGSGVVVTPIDAHVERRCAIGGPQAASLVFPKKIVYFGKGGGVAAWGQVHPQKQI